jgi:hypothetical protein
MAQNVSLELASSGLPSVVINGDIAPTDAQVPFNLNDSWSNSNSL